MAKNTVLLTVTGYAVKDTRKAGGTISPGDLLTVNSDGDVIRHATAGGAAAKMIALENTPFNKTLADDYLTGEQIYLAYCGCGQKVSALVAASASAIVKGDLLESDGTGKLRKHNSGVALFQAEGAVDNSAGATPARIEATAL